MFEDGEERSFHTEFTNVNLDVFVWYTEEQLKLRSSQTLEDISSSLLVIFLSLQTGMKMKTQNVDMSEEEEDDNIFD